MSCSLSVCCIILLCLSSRLESRTVSPIEYEYTDSPRNAYNGYVDGTSYTGGTGYGGTTGYAHHGYVGSSTRVAPATYGYGHRSMPDLNSKVRRGRDDDEAQTHALYESPNTYEYMNNPGSKSERTRVPKTEKRPPGNDDVELIGGEPPVVAAASHKNRRRPNGGHGKKKRKTTSAGGGNHGNDGVGYSVSEPDVESSPSKKRPRKKKNIDGGGTVSGKSNKTGKGAADVADDVIAGPVSKHKVHEKKEYSKKQRFFDEEHVKKPSEATAESGGRKKAQKEQRTQMSTPKSTPKPTPKPTPQQKQTQRQSQQYRQQWQPYGAPADAMSGSVERQRLMKAQKTVLLQQPSAVLMQDNRYGQARPRLSTGYGQIIALR